ncbi:P27 family phage terminase small subunit [Bacillus sp. ISL-75]|uniref:P27 family phage terminase small subunit n=1 Tax=Bacillus sp. ISL-75 TaxID=2819137 RepID=UPI001BEA8267|nr:P27 family phage terminase small subunit [Bacillus sp. ISL-75]MBT2728387.1 P27 family phage terminase small subunit [Bacillus sp. ISL-75]
MNKFEMKTKENLQALGIYQPEFDVTISIYSSLVEQYQALEKEFKKSKFTVVEKTGYSENQKKHPIVVSLESLRKDILAYSNALGLTPAGLKKIKANMKDENKNVSKLEMALNKFGS